LPRPSNDVIAAHYAAAGSIRQAARTLGLADSTLRGWIKADDELAAIFGTSHSPDITAASKEAEIRELKRNLKQLSEALGKREEWLNQVIEAARVPVTRPVYKAPDRDPNLSERSIVLPIYDIQYGQLVQPTDVPFGKGSYSSEIFDERLKTYVDRITMLLQDRARSTNFTELHFVLGGDLVEGDQIYPGMPWQLQKDPVRQSLDLRVKLSAAIKQLIHVAKEDLGVEAIALYAVPGNHGKVGGKRAGATPTSYSWDYLTAALIIDDLREEHVDLTVNESAGALLFETLGHTFLTIHGDELKGHAGIPFYGFQRLDGKAIRLSEVIFDYGLSGHIHQPASIPNGSGGEWNTQPDWVGGNNLSKHIVAASRPGQKLLIVGAKQGICSEERIYFDDRRARHKATIHRVRKTK
jgi:transposase-like protein